MLYAFITWYPWDPVKQVYPAVVRGHGLNEDSRYLCGDKEAKFKLPAIPMEVSINRCCIIFRSWIEKDSEHYCLLTRWDYA